MFWTKVTSLLMVVCCGTAMSRHVTRDTRGLDLPNSHHEESGTTPPHRVSLSVSSQTHNTLELVNKTSSLPITEERSGEAPTSVKNESTRNGINPSGFLNGTLAASNWTRLSASNRNVSWPARSEGSLFNQSGHVFDETTSLGNGILNKDTPLPKLDTHPTDGKISPVKHSTPPSHWSMGSNQSSSWSNQKNPFIRQAIPLSRQDESVSAESGGSKEPYGCQKLSACVCETENGARVDLTPLASTNSTPRFSGVLDGNSYVYAWNPCYSFSEQQGCQNVALCQTVVRTTEWGYYNLGTEESADFLISSSRGLMLKYSGQGGAGDIPFRTSYVQLKCDPDVEADFSAQGETMHLSGIYYFTLVSRHACLSGGGHTTTPVTSPAPTPSPTPAYSLKTVVDLLFVLTVIAALGLIVLLVLLTVICLKNSSRGECSRREAPTARAAGAPKFYEASRMPEPFYTVSSNASWMK